MKLQKKHLILTLIILGVLGIYVLIRYTNKLSPEFIIAGIAYLLALIQAKLSGNSNENDLKQIKEKRKKWQQYESEYDRRSEEIESKLNRAAAEAKRLGQELDSVRGAGVSRRLTEDEILERLREGGSGE